MAWLRISGSCFRPSGSAPRICAAWPSRSRLVNRWPISPGALKGRSLGDQRLAQCHLGLTLGFLGLTELVAVDPGRDGRADGQNRRQHGRRDIGRGQPRVALAPAPELLDGPDPAPPGGPSFQVSPQLIPQLPRLLAPILGVLGQSLVHDRLEIPGNATVVLPQRRRSLVGDLVDELDLVSLVKGGVQGQHLVERGAQGVDVTPAIGDAPKPLGCHEPQRPDQVVRLREVVTLDELGQAEVGDPGVAPGVEQEVRGFDVAVDDILTVCVVERVSDLGPQPRDLAEVNDFGLAGE